MKISTSKSDIMREARRLSRGTRNEQRRLLLVGFQSEFEHRVPAIINGKLGTLPGQILNEVFA
jgi:hypothetical protein